MGEHQLKNEFYELLEINISIIE